MPLLLYFEPETRSYWPRGEINEILALISEPDDAQANCGTKFGGVTS